MLLEKLPNTVLDIPYRESKADSNLLRGDLETLAKDKDVEGATRDVMVCLEDLKGLDESFCASLFIHSDSLKSGNKGAFKFLGHELDILGVEVGAALHVAKVRLRLPMEVPEPVLFRLRELLAVCFDVFTVHELVEGKLHRVLAVGEAIVAI